MPAPCFVRCCTPTAFRSETSEATRGLAAPSGEGTRGLLSGFCGLSWILVGAFGAESPVAVRGVLLPAVAGLAVFIAGEPLGLAEDGASLDFAMGLFASELDFLEFSSLSGDTVGAFGFDLAAAVFNCLGLAVASSLISPSSPLSSSSELATISADMTFGLAFSVIWRFAGCAPSRSETAASREISFTFLFFSLASSAARALFGSFDINLFMTSPFGPAVRGVEDPSRGVFATLAGLLLSLIHI